MSDWYYAADNEQKGPINEAQLKEDLATNKLSGDTLVWKEGMDAWTPANQVPAFSFRQPPIPAKVQPPTTSAVATSPATASETTSVASSATPVDLKGIFGKAEALEVDPADAEKNKVMGILAYLIFFLPLITAKDSPFARYHANQGAVLCISCIGLMIVMGILSVILGMILPWNPMFIISNLIFLGILVLAVLGIINAANGKCVPLPVIGGIKIIK